MRPVSFVWKIRIFIQKETINYNGIKKLTTTRLRTLKLETLLQILVKQTNGDVNTRWCCHMYNISSIRKRWRHLIKIKWKTKNITLSEQFQDQISKS